MAVSFETRNKPSSFLDLPVELRLRVYQFLPITTRHVHVYLKSPVRDIVWCRLVVRTMPVSILATSRLINAEASPIINPQLEKLIARPPQFIFDWGCPIRFGYTPAMSILAQALRQDKSMKHIDPVGRKSRKYMMERLALHPGLVAVKKKERALLWTYLVQLHRRYIRHVSEPTNRANNVTIQLAIDKYQDDPFLLVRDTTRPWPLPRSDTWSDTVVYSAARLVGRVPPQDGLVEVVPVLADGRIDAKGLLHLQHPTQSAKDVMRGYPMVIPETIAEDAFMEGEKYL